MFYGLADSNKKITEEMDGTAEVSPEDVKPEEATA